MRIEQALDFIHACPPAKFEGLSDLLSPELIQACLAENGSISLRRRRMPMERRCCSNQGTIPKFGDLIS